MEFDFTSIPDRRGKDSIAVDHLPVQGAQVEEGFSRIPMWVADMSFATAPSVVRAIKERAEHPFFGYFSLPESYYQSIIRWQAERNDVKGLEARHIGYENGVLGGVASALQAFTSPGEPVLIHAPTYIGFTGTIQGNGRKLVWSPLKRDEQGVWRMDYEDMDAKLRENRIHWMVFCSPHNPSGRVWERWELEKTVEICRQNDCFIISDEIWSDLILPGGKHIPLQSVSEDARNRTIALYSPSKSFNLAGLVGSYHVVYDSYLRDRLGRQGSLSHYNSPNVLSVHALTGAYSPEGARWLDELLTVLQGNVEAACSYFRERVPEFDLTRPEGTYLLYPDCSAWCTSHGKTLDQLLLEGIRVGVLWQDGRPFQRPETIRINLAVPHSQVLDALDRLDRYVFNPQ